MSTVDLINLETRLLFNSLKLFLTFLTSYLNGFFKARQLYLYQHTVHVGLYRYLLVKPTDFVGHYRHVQGVKSGTKTDRFKVAKVIFNTPCFIVPN